MTSESQDGTRSRRSLIEETVERLPELERIVFVLLELEFRSVLEVTEITGLAPVEVRDEHRSSWSSIDDIARSEFGFGATDIRDAIRKTYGDFRPEQEFEEVESELITLNEFRANPSRVIGDPRIFQFLAENPEELQRLDWRRFEELTAEMLAGFGYDVKLSPLGPDGGVDIFAERRIETGTELVLVQCKRYGSNRKVSQPRVKQLRADVSDRRATRGLITTTSSFTGPAEDYIDSHRYRLTGADFDTLKGWLDRLRNAPG